MFIRDILLDRNIVCEKTIVDCNLLKKTRGASQAFIFKNTIFDLLCSWQNKIKFSDVKAKIPVRTQKFEQFIFVD